MKNLRLITWLTQFALSVITPLFLCILGAVWIRNRYATGAWVIILGIVIGFIAAVGGLVDSLHSMDRIARNDDKSSTVSFNNHE